MDRLHISFLEINPLVVSNNDLTFLDMAIEVDDAGEFFVEKAWVSEDFVVEAGSKTKEEEAIEELSSKSQASFRLVVLNPNGSIFMLLSGGGASIVLADEVYNVGQGKELANYGEYSGNPNAEETYLYTKEILSLLLSSSASNKKLIIAGGVANFTDIRITFKGVIKAIADVKTMLSEQGVKVFVRRGGPFEKEGLQMIEDFLKKENLYGFVTGPNLPLTEIVEKAIGGVHA
jgi:succinyl-CoA synthetase beta subunit